MEPLEEFGDGSNRVSTLNLTEVIQLDHQYLSVKGEKGIQSCTVEQTQVGEKNEANLDDINKIIDSVGKDSETETVVSQTLDIHTAGGKENNTSDTSSTTGINIAITCDINSPVTYLATDATSSSDKLPSSYPRVREIPKAYSIIKNNDGRENEPKRDVLVWDRFKNASVMLDTTTIKSRGIATSLKNSETRTLSESKNSDPNKNTLIRVRTVSGQGGSKGIINNYLSNGESEFSCERVSENELQTIIPNAAMIQKHFQNVLNMTSFRSLADTDSRCITPTPNDSDETYSNYSNEEDDDSSFEDKMCRDINDDISKEKDADDKDNTGQICPEPTSDKETNPDVLQKETTGNCGNTQEAKTSTNQDDKPSTTNDNLSDGTRKHAISSSLSSPAIVTEKPNLPARAAESIHSSSVSNEEWRRVKRDIEAGIRRDALIHHTLSLLLKRWAEYLELPHEQLYEQELENARASSCQEVVELMEDRDRYVWQLVEDLHQYLPIESEESFFG